MNNGTSFIPVGAVLAFASQRAPQGWLICNGDELRIEDYTNLYEVIGDAFNRTNTPEGFFCLPDLQGQFIRGWDADGNVDSQRDFGSPQEDAFQGHLHSFNVNNISLLPSGKHNHKLFAKQELKSSGMFEMETMLKHTTTCKEKTASAGEHSHKLTCKNTPVGNPQTSIFEQVKVGSETRPKNIALLYCIKY